MFSRINLPVGLKVALLSATTLLASSSIVNADLIAGTATFSAAATETNLQFDATVGLRSASVPNQAQAQAQIRKQILFMQSNFRRMDAAAVRSNWHAQVNKIEKAGPNVYRIYYHFVATAMVANSLVNTIEVLLPVNPDGFENQQRAANCVDEHKGAFWYYWNPTLAGCGMTLNSDYLSVNATFTRYANTTQTYPEYNRLFVNGVARLAIIMGKPDPTNPNLPTSNPWSYPVVRNTLLAAGFQNRQLTPAEVQAYTQAPAGSEPFMEEYSLATAKGSIVVTLFFGNTEIEWPNQDHKAYQRFYKWALENASVIFYGGHAGTGKNLNLNLVKQETGLTVHPRTDIYQILMISACYPYAYYVNDYFNFKATAADPRGTKNLDIMAEGIESRFQNFGPQIAAVLQAITDFAQGKKLTSYQEIISSSPAFSQSLFSVQGDEDNTVPQLN